MKNAWAVAFAISDGICTILKSLGGYLDRMACFPDETQLEKYKKKLDEFEERINNNVEALQTEAGLSYCARGDLYIWRKVMSERSLLKAINLDIRDYRDKLKGVSSSLAFTTKHMGHDGVSEYGLVENMYGSKIALYSEAALRNPWALDLIDVMLAERLRDDYTLEQAVADFEAEIKDGKRGLRDMYQRHLDGSLHNVTTRYWIPEVRRF